MVVFNDVCFVVHVIVSCVVNVCMLPQPGRTAMPTGMSLDQKSKSLPDWTITVPNHCV